MRHLLALGLVFSLLGAPPLFEAAARVRQGQPTAAGREAAYRANNTGVAHLEQFNYGDAEKSFREALAQQPDLDLARLNLALALLYGSRPADALVEARAAAARLQTLPQAHFVLGLAARADDKVDDAIAAFTRVLAIDPRDAGTKVHLGQLHLQQRQYPEALRLFREALDAEPYNVTAAYNSALALTRSGQAEDGRAAMQRFEQLRDSPYGVTYSQMYLGQGRYGEGIVSTGAEPDLVPPSVPVTFSDATSAMLPAPQGQSAQPSAGARNRIALVDADADGDLDLIGASPSGLRYLRNDGGRFVEDPSRFAGLTLASAAGVVAGDLDNDSRPDLLVLQDTGYRLLRQKTDGAFEDITAAAGVKGSGPAAAGVLADLDHDGDLDAIVAGAALEVQRNNGNGTFTDIGAASGLQARLGEVAGIAAVDIDNRRDVDVLVAASGAAPILFRNLRDGSFRDAAEAFGLPAAGSYSALGIADVNKDGYTDVLLARRDNPAVLALSDGQGRFRTHAAPDGTAGAIAAQFFDYDSDGLLDLATLSGDRLRLFRAGGANVWSEVTDAAGLTGGAGPSAFSALALGDVDRDGDTDIFLGLANGGIRVWRNDSKHHRSVAVRLAPRISNRSGYGAKIEMRAGSLRSTLDAVASSPAVVPADYTFGLGPRDGVDAIRVLWPSGILQAETSIVTASAATKPGGHVFTVAELDRKPSSCPYLFTWNGTRFEFVTDVMGGGEMGGWLAPSVWNQPDPDEYVRIRAQQLQPRDGRYELRLTNELEEALFFDRVQLIVVDHEDGVDVFPNEGLRSAPRPPFRLTSTRSARPPVRAVDGHGHDVLPQLRAIDRSYVDDFRTLPIRGYAEPHELVLDLGAAPADAVLLLTGWTDYAFSSDNVAAAQAGEAMQPPSLQVRDAGGSWRTVVQEIGFPVGRPQTVVVPLAGRFLSASREVRVLTNMRIYWDQVLVADGADRAPLTMRRLDPRTADLRVRGFSREETPDGREPFSYDYTQVSTASPWKVMVGRYTREGDVRPLLRAADDLFVISRPGDEIALAFDALPPVAPGRARTFLLYVHGYSKEMNPRSAVPETVGPLPVAGMSGYPYRADEHYPRTQRHREYQDRYNTRIFTRPAPSIDALVRAGAQ